jgi:hypothetical protein
MSAAMPDGDGKSNATRRPTLINLSGWDIVYVGLRAADNLGGKKQR